jgi:2-(1,2-epoxy-1,2-dihydrophenyl)acetyl-CoA isomerase
VTREWGASVSSEVPLVKLGSETTPDGVLVLTISDPATRNALDDVLMSELVSEIKRFSADRELKVLLITGAGTAFSSGANVRGFARSLEERDQAGEEAADEGQPPWDQLDPFYKLRQDTDSNMGPEVVRLLYNLQKPSIAAVNGPAYGIGCGIALFCDIRIASESARFSEAFIRTGLVTGDGSAWLLPRLVGMANTLWMQYTGDPVPAREAYRIGLVNEVTSDEDLMSRSLEVAVKLARGPVFTMGLIKQIVQQGYDLDFHDALVLGAHAQAIARNTADHQEGVRAFIEKRPPRFQGR